MLARRLPQVRGVKQPGAAPSYTAASNLRGENSMKKLVLSSLMTVLVSQAAGCIITSGGSAEDAQITVQWSLKQQATNQIITCPPDVTSARIYTLEVDSNYNPIAGEVYSDGPCNDNSSLVIVDPGIYQVWVELVGADVYARSLSAY